MVGIRRDIGFHLEALADIAQRADDAGAGRRDAGLGDQLPAFGFHRRDACAQRLQVQRRQWRAPALHEGEGDG